MLCLGHGRRLRTFILAISTLVFSTRPTWGKERTASQPSSPSYDIVVRLLPEERSLHVEGTIRIPSAPETRNSLRFALSKSFPDLKLEPLEPAEILGGIQAKAVWQSQYGKDCAFSFLIHRRRETGRCFVRV